MAITPTPYANYFVRYKYADETVCDLYYTWLHLCFWCRNELTQRATQQPERFRDFTANALCEFYCDRCGFPPALMPRALMRKKYKSIRRIISYTMYGEVDEKGNVINP